MPACHFGIIFGAVDLFPDLCQARIADAESGASISYTAAATTTAAPSSAVEISESFLGSDLPADASMTEVD